MRFVFLPGILNEWYRFFLYPLTFFPLFSMNIFCFKISFVSFRFYEFATNGHFESVPESKIDFFFSTICKWQKLKHTFSIMSHVNMLSSSFTQNWRNFHFVFFTIRTTNKWPLYLILVFLLPISRIGDLPLYYTDTRTSGDFICGKPKSNGMQTCSAIPP